MRLLTFSLLVTFVVPCMAADVGSQHVSFWTRLGNGIIDWIGKSQPSFGKFAALVVALGLVWMGVRLPGFINGNTSLKAHAFELMAIVFILPVVLIVSIIPGSQDATLAVIGTMIGYVFGVQGGKNSGQNRTESTTKPPPPENDG